MLLNKIINCFDSSCTTKQSSSLASHVVLCILLISFELHFSGIFCSLKIVSSLFSLVLGCMCWNKNYSFWLTLCLDVMFFIDFIKLNKVLTVSCTKKIHSCLPFAWVLCVSRIWLFYKFFDGHNKKEQKSRSCQSCDWSFCIFLIFLILNIFFSCRSYNEKSIVLYCACAFLKSCGPKKHHIHFLHVCFNFMCSREWASYLHFVPCSLSQKRIQIYNVKYFHSSLDLHMFPRLVALKIISSKSYQRGIILSN